ncbi:DUF2860 family protein [Campylobacter sp. MIT 97-5078]|uniref:DUF2860 family protein n=1 Tax=Campylobacter sp. MIT 97-5078 TaxID=1548153 RepID=UPI000512CD5F|nr:DUF2860 family protein [Campylobacter sp. MIT 97-5078]KGI55616.1 hypothetical protein LR59_11215 [Campylobacter sp. MIT 97-5078]KGI57575.1 hypothetical protein LR59_02480 [Campylobacter sp. MIT 97-5078]KGI57668.1 hypothetical protein LR59_03005 [Campylobacter sp. MIT 97-5078]KGI57728.1 hypothetical protein LR59_03335 [Campylobacter sp. MIT 97-5078]TQR26608.1 DUF2860 domain-containing protein [Campylobacter sp. MIT 97-5078]
MQHFKDMALIYKLNFLYLKAIFYSKFDYSHLKALKSNVIFNDIQKAHNIKANFNLVKLGILSYKKAYAFANYGFELRENSINFYDEQFQFLLLGLGYRF